MEPTLKVAKDFPDVKFESITGYKTAPNVATANARYYEGRFLAGIAAGKLKPFSGPIADNEGHEVLAKGKAMTDNQILDMNFLVSGVQGKIVK